MITKLKNIKNFGVFNNFDWDNTVRTDKGNNIVSFNKMNILYGRNYSGKTTLSRIFRCFKKLELHKKYLKAKFEIEHSGSGVLNQSNLSSPYTFRVYNKDFINENLSWLSNDDGVIKPFAVLGETNVTIETEIIQKQSILGSIDKKTGLRFELKNKEDEYKKKEKEFDKKQKALDEKLKEKASLIKRKTQICDNITYNISNISADIKKIIDNINYRPLSDDKKQIALSQIQEKPKDRINTLQKVELNCAYLYDTSSELLKKNIEPTESIQALLNDHFLSEWVLQGSLHHRGKRDTCAFCGQKIPEDLWDRLDRHFNEESKLLKDNIEYKIKEIEEEKNKLQRLRFLKKEQFYINLQDKFDQLNGLLIAVIDDYIKGLDILISLLSKRCGQIFKPSEIVPDYPEFINDLDIFMNIQIDLNNLIEENNELNKTLQRDHAKAKEELRLTDVFEFIEMINYKKETSNIKKAENEKDKLRKEVADKTVEISELENEIKKLKESSQDESQGANKINEYLNNYFGHNNLTLKPQNDDSGKVYSFIINRMGREAHSLSEGECSLISFCYYMAKLEEIDTKDKELIIWIDDPISSLDSNHIFFVFSLIENEITKPKKYQQLFISTHNLEFLKYLKKLTRPFVKDQGTKNKIFQDEYFIIESFGEESKIKPMPTYLKNFVTEFNYLFDQIYRCVLPDAKTEIYFNFGNNLRKFLEAYLYYKYPGHDSTEALKKFFGDNKYSTDVINRIQNEYSHLCGIFERSMRPLDIPEMKSIAEYVLLTIKENDSEQFYSLLKSINGDPASLNFIH